MAATESENFKIVREHIVGKIKVFENTQFNNIDAEQIEVMPGVKARLFGTAKDIIVHEKSKVFVHGKIHDKIDNRGGRLYIYTYTNNP